MAPASRPRTPGPTNKGLGLAGRDKSAPQVFLTVLYHLGLGLPWDFRVGPGTDSERRHMGRMIGSLPQGSLLAADAGFVSYEFCRDLTEAGHDFVPRVGGNITLLRGLGYHHREAEGVVYLWPKKHRKGPPLVLRLIALCQQGKEPVYLLSSELDPAKLSDDTAADYYRMRWGEEGILSLVQADLGQAHAQKPHARDVPGGGHMRAVGPVAVGADERGRDHRRRA